MEGVLMAVLRGRSRAGDAGFLGRLALRLVEGIDAAHAKPPSDPDVLSPVVEELEVKRQDNIYVGFFSLARGRWPSDTAPACAC